MPNIVTYLHTQQHTFSEIPFNPVDSLIFSTVSYFNLECSRFDTSYNSPRVLLHDIIALEDKNLIMKGNWLADSSSRYAFYDALMASRRFRDVSVSFYINETADAVEKQFCAMSFFLCNDMVYLAFRGTDGSFAGWKEDFNLSFKHVIPSQVSAMRYLSGVASATSLPLMLGGHSKGGNLAEFAALTIEDHIFDRIVGVYNHDGPSFFDDPTPRIHTEAYQNKLYKTVPESSAFGMMLERRDDFQIVQSDATFVFQHEPFTWFVDGNDFLYQEKLNTGAVFVDSTIDMWLRSKTTDERERFIDTIYELFVSTQEATSWPEFNDKLLRNTKKLIQGSAQMDPETKRFIIKTITSFVAIVKSEAIKKIKFSLPRRGMIRKTNYEDQPQITDSEKAEHLTLKALEREELQGEKPVE